MAKPQQPELRRSGFTAPLDPDSVESELEAREHPGTRGGPEGTVPEDNLPGHHPDEEQDKPSGEEFVEKAKQLAEEADQRPAKKPAAKKASAKKASAQKASAKKAGAKKATKAAKSSAKARAGASPKKPPAVPADVQTAPPPRPAVSAKASTPAPPTKTSAPTAPPVSAASPPAPSPAAPEGLVPRTTYGRIVGVVAETPVRLVGVIVRQVRRR